MESRMFRVNGKEYVVTEHQSANPDSYIWNDYFTVSRNGVVLGTKFDGLTQALLFVLQNAEGKS